MRHDKLPEITRRRTGELLRKLFEILLEHPEGMQASLAMQELASRVVLSEYEKGEYESGGRRFDKVVRFATVDTVKAGWLTKTKGLWSVTEEGRKAFKTFPDPEAFGRRALQLYNEWRKSQPVTGSVEPEDPGDSSSEKVVSVTFEEAEEQAWAEVSTYLQKMPPYEFQELVGALLRAMGYYVAWIAPPGKDGGTDIIAWSDPLGTRAPRIKVQVKRQDQKVSVDGLRSFMAVLGEEDVGLFVSLGGFTKDAQDEARSQQKRKITLVDLERLFDLWLEFYDKIKEKERRLLPLRPIHFLAPEG